MTFRKCSKNGGDGGTGVYMREGTTLRVMAADRPYGEFYDFYMAIQNILDTTSYINTGIHVSNTVVNLHIGLLLTEFHLSAHLSMEISIMERITKDPNQIHYRCNCK
jgi:hypothetical protein